MSMGLLTLFQFLVTLSAYLLITMALPCAVLGKKLRRYRFMDRIMLYFIIGNFYVTNLVILLELLHISNYFTILIGLLVIPGIIGCRLNKYPFTDAMRSFGTFFRKLLTGSMGFKSAAHTLWEKVWGRMAKTLKRIVDSIRKDWPDWLLTVALIVMVVFVYGVRMVNDFGYTVSDIPVHLHWVNRLSENTIFAEGIYPYGMHALIYLLHTVFRIDAYVIFRVFALVQCFAIHMMALLFLRLCCKSRFAAYTGMFLYTLGSYVVPSNIIRYLSTLPQETSMIYILPTAYFAFLFFREKSSELKEAKALEEAQAQEEAKAQEEAEALEAAEALEEAQAQEEAQTLEGAEVLQTAQLADGPAELAAPEQPEVTQAPQKPKKSKRPKKPKGAKRPKGEKKRFLETPSGVALAGLAMSFSLCLSAHTYGAFIAALFCLGIAVGHIGWLIRPAYFTRLIAAALVSVMVTTVPMWIAYKMGTPIQSSFDWAVSVIAKSVPEEPKTQPQAPPAAVEDTQSEGLAGVSGEVSSSPMGDMEVSPVREPGLLEKAGQLLEEGKQFGSDLWDGTGRQLESYVLGFSFKPSVVFGTYIRWSITLRVMMILLVVAGIGLLLFRRTRLYGAMLLSTGVFAILLSVVIAASELGLPVLMDEERASIFYSYILIVVVGLAVDVCLFLLGSLLGKRWNKDVLSFAAVTLLVIFMWQEGDVRASLAGDGLETNEAITCLTNIIATEKDNTWTIFSANDETQMVYGHGYHYELSTFLEEISWPDREPVTVPTPTVYFFIEKIPLDYVGYYWGSGQSVSSAGAQNPVPEALGYGVYVGEKRWIIMSHMYYWAQEFQRMYPHEMSVYMETDRFICYRLEQNTYRLFDLGIDYGYNS